MQAAKPILKFFRLTMTVMVARVEMMAFIMLVACAFSGQAWADGEQSVSRPFFYGNFEGGVLDIADLGAGQYLAQYGDGTPPRGYVYPSFEANVGYQFSDSFWFELGGKYASVDLGSPSAVEGSWVTYGFYLMPTLRIFPPKGSRSEFWGAEYLQTIGIQVGPAFLTGASVMASPGAIPAYDVDYNSFPNEPFQTGIAPDVGLVYRIQDIHDPLKIGLEIAYDYEDFTTIDNHPGIANNPNGSRLALNFSGFSAKLVIGTWFGSGVSR